MGLPRREIRRWRSKPTLRRTVPITAGGIQLRNLCALVGVLTPLLSGCPADAGDRVTLRPTSGDPVSVSVELATNPQSRQMGLMYRSELGPDKGMLFVFPQEQRRSFWMRNTKIPLDILYLDEDGRIANIHESTTPFSEKPLPSTEPVRFVLEVEGGFCAEHGIAAGDRVELGRLAATPTR